MVVARIGLRMTNVKVPDGHQPLLHEYAHTHAIILMPYTHTPTFPCLFGFNVSLREGVGRHCLNIQAKRITSRVGLTSFAFGCCLLHHCVQLFVLSVLLSGVLGLAIIRLSSSRVCCGHKGCSHPPLLHAVCSLSVACTVGPRSAVCIHRTTTNNTHPAFGSSTQPRRLNCEGALPPRALLPV